MKSRDLLFLSLRYARSRLLESLVIMLSMAIGVAVFTTAIGLIQAYARDLSEVLAHPSYREILVAPGSWETRVRSGPPAEPPPLSAGVAERAVAQCSAVSYGYVASNWGEGGESANSVLLVKRVSPPFFEAWGLEAAEGALLVDADIREMHNVAVIGARLARQLFGAESPIGKTIGYQNYRIIGVLRPATSPRYSEEMGGSTDNSAFIPYTYFPEDYGAGPPPLGFMVPRDGSMEAAETQLRSFFDQEFGKGSVTISSPRATVLSEQRIAVPLFTLIAIAAGTILACLSVAILNLLFHRVARRRASLGLAAAVGASRRDVFRLYLAEFALTGLVGGLLGIAVSLGFVQVVQRLLNPEGSALPGLRIGLSITSVGLALSIVLALELAMSIVPALQASSSSPVESMRGGQA